MNYTVIIDDNCKGCVRVLRYLAGLEIPFNVVDRDQSDDQYPGVMVVPALLQGSRLLAYGEDDIISTLRAQF